MKGSMNKVLVILVLIGMFLSTEMVVAKDAFLPQKEQPSAISSKLSARETGGPDEFGYTWDDGVDYEWIDTTGGTNVGLSGSGKVSEPVEIGFSFPFYENTYSEVYITTHGWITFDALPPDYSGFSYLPAFLNPILPNNVIAPLWDSYTIYDNTEGAIYTLRGGEAPNRYFVVEWYDVAHQGSYSRLCTFQVILRETGEIVMQYQTTPDSFYGIVGIEDSRGMDGLNYPYTNYIVDEGQSVKFTPPGPAKRVYLSPQNQDSLTNLVSHDYELQLINIGTDGPDTYTLASDSVWDLSLFEDDGFTEIIEPITIPLHQGQSKTIIARVFVPAGAAAADDNTAMITVTSSDDSISKETIIYSAIPAPFAQVYVDGQVSTYLVSPQELRQVDIQDLSSNDTDAQVAILKLPNGNLLYAWSQYRGEFGKTGWMIHYSIHDRDGNVVLGRTLLSDLSGGGAVRKDFAPALAVTPDGRIGVLWYRSDEESASPYRTNPHLRFAILNINGLVEKVDHNITEDSLWHDGYEVGSTWYYRPNIATTDDGLFVVSWIKSTILSEGLYDYDIYYKVLNDDGVIVEPITNLTESLYPFPPFDNMTMIALADGRIFFALTVTEEANPVVNFLVLDLDGEEGILITPLTEFWGALDVVQLSDGRIFLAGQTATQIKYIIFDEVVSPGDIFTLPDPLGSNENKFVSVTSDSQAHAILTYQTKSPATGKGMIMYALVGSAGTLVTKPVPFHTAQTGNLSVSRFGQSITTYNPAPNTQAPEFSSEPTAIITVGDFEEVVLAATGMPLPLITMDATLSDALPGGLSFTPGTGTATLSGTPADGSGGIYELVFVASNGVVPDATQEFTLIVKTVQDIADQGGTITSNDGSIEIQVQPGAVSGEATFTLTPQSEPAQETGGFTFAGISFTLTAEDGEGHPITEFDEPLIITIIYDPDALGEINPEILVLYYWDEDEGAWLDAICDGYEYERDLMENWFSLVICHLSEFAVMAEETTGINIFLPLILR